MQKPRRTLALGLVLLSVCELFAQSPDTSGVPLPTLPPSGSVPALAPPAQMPLSPGVGHPDGPLVLPGIPCPNCPATTAPAAPEAQSCWTRETLTGDWWGLRSDLKECGITFEGNLTQFGFGISGGVNRLPPGGAFPFQFGDTFEYTGRGDYAFTFDLEKFGSPLPKGKLLVRAQHWFGDYGNVSLNTGAFAPAVFAAALPPVPDDQGIPYMTDFFLTQPFSKNFAVFVGKKNVIGAADQDDFAGGNGTNQFMNQSLIANPAFLLALPYTGFTAGVVSPQEWGELKAYVYDPKDRTKDFFRLDDLFAAGIIVGAEMKVKTNFFSLPGEQHFGGIWKHVDLTDLRFNEPPPGVYPEPTVPGFPTLSDSYTIYYGFDQYFQVLADNPKRGWGMFGRASLSDGNPTPIRYFLSAGIGGYSPLAPQRGDTFGIGWFYTGASREFGPLPRFLFGPRPGWGMELYYNFQLTPWMNLTPDFQILKPEAGTIANMAYIGGLRLNLKF